jgi:hypothetical protein
VARDYLDVMMGGRLDEWEKSGYFRQEIIPFSDHTFTLRSSQDHLTRAIAEWVGPAPETQLQRTVQ